MKKDTRMKDPTNTSPDVYSYLSLGSSEARSANSFEFPMLGASRKNRIAKFFERVEVACKKHKEALAIVH